MQHLPPYVCAPWLRTLLSIQPRPKSAPFNIYRFTSIFSFLHKAQASIKTELRNILVAKPFAAFPQNRYSGNSVSSSLRRASFHSDAASDCWDIVVQMSPWFWSFRYRYPSLARLSFLVFQPSLTYSTPDWMAKGQAETLADSASLYYLLAHWRTHFAKEIQVSSGSTRGTACVLNEHFGYLHLGDCSRYRDGTKRALKGTAFPIFRRRFPRKLPPPVFQNFC